MFLRIGGGREASAAQEEKGKKEGKKGEKNPQKKPVSEVK